MEIKLKQKPYALYIIKLLVILMFTYFLIKGISAVYDYFLITGSYNGVSSIYPVIIAHSFFRPVILALIPFVGIFIKNKLGWILISSYFYFFLINILVNIDESYLIYIDDSITILIISCFIIAIVFVLFLINKKSISFGIYKISPNLLLLYNLIPSILGFTISICLLLDRYQM